MLTYIRTYIHSSTYIHIYIHTYLHKYLHHAYKHTYIPTIGVCMYVCMVITYHTTYSKNVDQPGKVANPARGKLNMENEYFPVPIRAWEFGLARRVQPSRPASAYSFSILRLNQCPPTLQLETVIPYSTFQNKNVRKIWEKVVIFRTRKTKPTYLYQPRYKCGAWARLTWDGTAEPVSLKQIFQARTGTGKNIIFSVQLTTSRIGNLTRLIHTLLEVMTIHTP